MNLFNPYLGEPAEALSPRERRPPEPAPPPPPPQSGLVPALMERLGRLDREDLLIAALVYLLASEGEEDRLLPVLAAGLYLLMG